LLDGYWQSRPDEVVKREILRDWIDMLDGYSQDEITSACREWLREQPRKKPNAGDIRAIIQRGRAEIVAKHKASLWIKEERPERVSADTATRLMREVFGERVKNGICE
jgi:hypothetical protein